MTIRRYSEPDREALKRISAVCFEGVSIDHNIEQLSGPIAGKDWAWRKKLQIEDDIDNYPDGIFVAEIDDAVVGFVTTRVDRRKGIGSIPDLAVLPDHRRQGLAKTLLDQAIAHLQGAGMTHVRLDTLEQNAVCQEFYPKRGFKEAARVIHYIMEIKDAQ